MITLRQTIRILLVLLLALHTQSCKRNTETNYHIRGQVTDADDGTALAGVSIEIEKQVVQNGIYGNTYQNALVTSTNSSGAFEGSWLRENFAALRLLATKDNYISSEKSLDIDDFEGGSAVIQNVAIYKEAFSSLRFQHFNGSSNDRLSFTFLNAIFDCNCCSNGWKTWQGADIDTTLTCRAYGNRWLKYQVLTQLGSSDTSYVDSIYCEAFTTTSRNIQY